MGQKRKIEKKTINFTMMAWIMEGARRASSLQKEYQLFKENPIPLTSTQDTPDDEEADGGNLFQRVFSLG